MSSVPALTVTLPLLHPGQRAVVDDPARFKVLACGRRWGKTMLGSALCVHKALMGGRAWWVAPSYKMAVVGWRGVTRLARQIPGAIPRKGERSVAFPGGGEVWVRSADDPQSLRGEGLDLVVMDECAYIAEAAWTEALRPALSDRQGGALFISTPAGRNWFWRHWLRGNDGDRPDWRAWQNPTADNPHIVPAEIEAARTGLPDRIFRQEYLAEFIEDAGLVFRGIRKCVQPADYAHRHNLDSRYVIGVDWAQMNDFTAFYVIDAATGQVVDYDRFNQIDWEFQRGRLRAMSDRWHAAYILAELNSIGSPNVEALQREGLRVVGFTTTNETKAQIVQALALAFERGEIGIPDDAGLTGELEAFEAERLTSGKWRYAAPEGMHDDRVIALALAWWAKLTTGGPLIVSDEPTHASKWGGLGGRKRF